MGSALHLRTWIAAMAIAALPGLALAETVTADYALAPAIGLGGEPSGTGLSLRAGRNWFGQVGLASNDVMNLAGGYRWANGQSLSLQLSRGRGAGQRLGLAVNYDWPHYFVRFSYDQGAFWNLVPQENVRLSAGIRF
jgi:hypothetical protein